jgi:hypothetical protein
VDANPAVGEVGERYPNGPNNCGNDEGIEQEGEDAPPEACPLDLMSAQHRRPP